MSRRGGRCGDEDIIHIDNDVCTMLQVFNVQVMEDVVHHCLEHAGGICQTEEHDQQLEQAVFCLKCSFFLISSFNLDVIVSPMDIKLGEDVDILNLTNQVQNEWQRVAVADGVFIQLAIVLYWA